MSSPATAHQVSESHPLSPRHLFNQYSSFFFFFTIAALVETSIVSFLDHGDNFLLVSAPSNLSSSSASRIRFSKQKFDHVCSFIRLFVKAPIDCKNQTKISDYLLLQYHLLILLLRRSMQMAICCFQKVPG